MNLLVKSILILLLGTATCYAESFICFDGMTMRITDVREGDCMRLGLCADVNNGGMQANCFIATPDEVSKTRDENVKVDMNVVVGSRVVDLTRAEIDAETAAEQQEQADAETTRLANLDSTIANTSISGVQLQRVEQAIDNIGNLNDAKAFLKKLVRYIASHPISE